MTKSYFQHNTKCAVFKNDRKIQYIQRFFNKFQPVALECYMWKPGVDPIFIIQPDVSPESSPALSNKFDQLRVTFLAAIFVQSDQEHHRFEEGQFQILQNIVALFRKNCRRQAPDCHSCKSSQDEDEFPPPTSTDPRPLVRIR